LNELDMMEFSVVRAEDSTPCASCASTARSDPERTSDAENPLSGSKAVPSKVSGLSWSVKPKEVPSARMNLQHHASVVVPPLEMGLQGG